MSSSRRSGNSEATQGTTQGATQSASGSKFKYDPKQSVEEKRKVRKDYRELLSKTDEIRQNIAENKASDLSEIISKGDVLYDKVKAPTEGVLDSRFLLNLSEIGAQMAKNMKVASGAFDVDEYLSRIASYVGGRMNVNRDDDEEQDIEAWDWDRLGRAAGRYSRRAPAMDCLLGPLEVTHTKRKGTKRARIVKEGPVVAPQQLQEADIQRSENETTRLVREIADLLEKEGGEEGINMFKFILDPSSFSTTVENFFYLSFLVRDGLVSLEDNDEGEPIITCVEAPNEDDYNQGVTRRQLVLELDMKLWEELIEAYEIKKAVIPSRKPAAAVRKGAWYG